MSEREPTREEWITAGRNRFKCPVCGSSAVKFAISLFGDFYDCMDCAEHAGTGYYVDYRWHTELAKRWKRMSRYKWAKRHMGGEVKARGK